jgi:P-aminobenzoate N-oxygenase AurF
MTGPERARRDEAAIERLNAASRHYRDPVAQIPWHELDPGRPWLPEPLVSLAALPDYAGLSPEQKRRLSQAEFVALAELGLWLEGLFLARFGRDVLRQLALGPAAGRYRLNELREEAGHSLMFLELMRRSGFPTLTPPRRRPPLAGLFARLVPAGSPVFWAAVLLGEAVPDQLGRLIAADPALPGAVRAIVLLHRREEARHIAYARLRLARDLPRLGSAARAALVPLLRLVLRQFLDTSFYPQPPVYAAAGLADAAPLARRVRRCPVRAALVAQCLDPSRRFLAALGLRL